MGNSAAISVPFFDGARLELDKDEAWLSEDGRKALAAFLALGRNDRLTASRHVFAYYLDQKAAFEEDDFLIDSMPSIASAEGVWGHVQPKLIFFQQSRSSAGEAPFVGIEADCDWEPEHGLMLCFRWGKTLTKCGDCDGHMTNESAFADNSLVGVVYKAIDPQYTPREDP
jgi:hypothetical protein